MRDVYFDPSLIFFPNSTKIRYEPLGVALIYGSWNFPYFVTLKPLANAIATGNCAIIKPSEMSPKSSSIIQKIVQKYLDNDCYRVILGDVNVSIKIGKFPFTASGKAKASGTPDGFVKVIFDAKYGEWLGCHMIGAGVTDMIAEAVVARKLETTGHEILKSIHPHPTMSEAVMEAVADAYGEVIHL